MSCYVIRFVRRRNGRKCLCAIFVAFVPAFVSRPRRPRAFLHRLLRSGKTRVHNTFEKQKNCQFSPQTSVSFLGTYFPRTNVSKTEEIPRTTRAHVPFSIIRLVRSPNEQNLFWRHVRALFSATKKKNLNKIHIRKYYLFIFRRDVPTRRRRRKFVATLHVAVPKSQSHWLVWLVIFFFSISYFVWSYRNFNGGLTL